MKEIRIYVPDAVPAEVARMVKTELAECYGGFTATPAQGGWIDADGQLIEEAVTVISAVGRDADLHPSDSMDVHARELAALVRDRAGEDAVLWQITESNHGLEA